MVCPAYPAFNIYSRPARVMTAMGPVCIATTVHDIPGWDAEIIDENNYRSGIRADDGHPDHEAIQESRPAKVVGLYGGLTSTIPRLLKLAQRYKAMGVMTVAGGAHFVDRNVEPALRGGVDVVVLGEGERTIAELLECIDSDGDLADVKGIAFLRDDEVVITPSREPICDFDELPIPDFSLLRDARMKYYPVSGTRGCCMNCEFCSVKGKPRFATADRMFQQFASIHEKHGGRVFFIVDDLFGQNRAETIRLCNMLRDYQRSRGVRFTITVQIRLDKARDAELLTAMREAGVGILAIGFESPIPQELEAMNKELKPQDMLDLVKLYQKAKFRIHGMFIFGYPMREGHEFHMPADERVKYFRRFLGKAKLDTVQVLQPIPILGTELYDRLDAQNRIFSLDDVGLEYYDGNFPVTIPDAPMTAEQVQAGAHQVMGHFYHPRTLLKLAGSLLAFPAIALRLDSFRAGWSGWKRRWKRNLYRAGGWLLLRQWTSAFRRDGFTRKLRRAEKSLRSRGDQAGAV